MCHNLCIIDDDPVSHCIINKLVEFNNLTDHHSNYLDARRALDDLCDDESELPDAILLDINMPGMNGWQFLDQIEELNGQITEIPIYIFSSSVDPADKIRSAHYHSVKGFLVKPLSVNDLKCVLG
jgi:two-component system chemotaxis response regulator CheY